MHVGTAPVCGDDVVAGPGPDCHLPLVGADPVGPRAGVDEVAAQAGVDAVGARAAEDAVGVRLAEERVGAGAAEHEVGPGARVHDVVVGAGVVAIGAGAPDHEVDAVAAVDFVVTGAGLEEVVRAFAEQAVVAALAVDLVRPRGARELLARLRAGRCLGHEEPGVEADLDLLGSDPARPLDDVRAVREVDAGLLLELANGRGRVAGVLGVHGAAGEDPGAAHKALLRIALDEEHLRAVRRVPQDDDRGGLTRLGHLTLVELLAGMGPVDPHLGSLTPIGAWMAPLRSKRGQDARKGYSSRSMGETVTAQLWMS